MNHQPREAPASKKDARRLISLVKRAQKQATTIRIAELLGVSDRTIRSWLKQERLPRAHIAERGIKALEQFVH